jgi:hypothetical protein
MTSLSSVGDQQKTEHMLSHPNSSSSSCGLQHLQVDFFYYCVGHAMAALPDSAY